MEWILGNFCESRILLIDKVIEEEIRTQLRFSTIDDDDSSTVTKVKNENGYI